MRPVRGTIDSAAPEKMPVPRPRGTMATGPNKSIRTIPEGARMHENNADSAPAVAAPERARGAWDANDADAFADLFVENGSILFDDDQLTDRDASRAHPHDAVAAKS